MPCDFFATHTYRVQTPLQNRLAKCYKNADAVKQSMKAYTLQNKNILQGSYKNADAVKQSMEAYSFQNNILQGSYKNADAVKQSVEAYSLQNNNILYGVEQDFKCSPESINITNVCPVAAAF